MLRWSWLENLAKDARYGLRQLYSSPGFAIVAVLTLALGIGANTAIFTLVHAVMLRSLPVANPAQLHSLGDNVYCCDTGAYQDSFTLYSYPLFKHLREQTPEFSDVAAFQSWLANLSVRRNGSAEPARPHFAEIVSGNYFSMLGVGALTGRNLNPTDDRPNSLPVAVISHRAWTQSYASDPSLIGSLFDFNGQPFTVVGVAPPGFFGETLRSDPPDFWIPLASEPLVSRDNPLLNNQNVYWLYAIGRLNPGVQPSLVQAKLTAEIKLWLNDQAGISAQDKQRIANLHMILTPAAGGIAGIQSAYGDGLRLLLIISMLVLLIACANIANLLMARGTANRTQIAVRIALGATRARLVRQMVTEGVLLALLGGMAGVALAFAGTRAILLLAFRGAAFVPINPNPSLSVLAFAFLLSLFTGVISSIVPTWIASRTHPAESLRGAGRSTRGNSAFPQKVLVVFQAALSVVLLAVAGLLTQSLRRLENQKFGFQIPGRVIVRLNPALAGYTPQTLPALYQKLEQNFARMPGVLSASYALHSPLDDWNWATRIFIEGRPVAANSTDNLASYDRVSAHYFETIGTRLLRGRVFDEHDMQGSRHVAIVNEAFERKFFPHDDSLGKHFGAGDATHSGDVEIVGVVEDARYRDEKVPADQMFFLPMLQTEIYSNARLASYQNWALFIDSVQLRVAGRQENLTSLVQRTLAEIDPNLTVLQIRTVDEQVAIRLNRPRLISRLTVLFGFLALILACVGLYGVTAYSVARRTSEIGLRIALGAGKGNVVLMMLKNSLAPVALGLVIGILAALAAGNLIASQLYGVKSREPLTVLSAVLLLLLSSILAAILPARRAASIDPIQALRTD
jgi:predicted permease